MMKRMNKGVFMIMIVLTFLGISLGINFSTDASAEEKVSVPGKYSGYSPVLYDGYKIFSQYVAVRDGTKLAVDIIRPTQNGVVVDKRLPVVWMLTPYNRRVFSGGALTAQLYPGAALGLVKYGYVVAVVDKRGFYASYGTTYSLDGWDGYDITEWLAAQPWSTGKVGMWGCSATGGTQVATANLMPPSLKAIFPMSSGGGGISFEPSLPPTTPRYPSQTDKPGSIPNNDRFAVPVDEDKDGKMLAEAKDAHRYNYLGTVAAPIAPGGLEVPSVRGLPVSYAQLQQSKIAMYHAVNWDDLMGSPLSTVIRYNNLNNPQKLILGAGTHCIWCTEYSSKEYPLDFNIVTEELRFFDYWLKGIDNGIIKDPPVCYYTQNGTKGSSDWQASWQWPVPQAKTTPFYLGGGPAGTGYGVNDGILSTTAPEDAGAKDVYTTDYDIPLEMPYDGAVTIITQPMQSKKGLTYTTVPLAADMELTGHPVVHLWISSTATDGDFWVDLEDIDPDGKAKTIIPASGSPNTTIAPGQSLPPGLNGFRASNRTLNTPSYNRLGLPYHRMGDEDIKPLIPGEITELVFDLRPISYVVKAGHRIRMTITCVIGEATPRLSPAPVVTFHRSPTFSSCIALPVITPITATVRTESDKKTVTAYVTFPKILDPRYIQDIKTESITCNGNEAKSARLEGDAVIAVFNKKKLSKDATLRLHGKFGKQYNYGDMTFTAIGAVP